MIAFIKKHDLLLRLLALLVAVIIWAVVRVSENSDGYFTLNDIPFNITGQDALLAEHGLTVIEGADARLAVTVKGPNNDITAKGFKNKIKIAVDVSDITEPGEYDIEPSVVITQSDVERAGIKPTTVRLRVDKIETKTVEVKLRYTGAAASGYRVGTLSSTTENVTIEGPSTDLDEVAYALVTASAAGANATVRQDCAVTLCNAAGEVIESPYVTSKTQTIRVTMLVFKDGTVPLSVTLKDSDTVTADMAKVTINPENVQVYMDQNEVSSLTEIDLGEIDLGSVKTNVPFNMPINLPDGVHLVDGQPKVAEITVAIDGVDTRTVRFDSTEIVLTDTSEVKEVFTATVLDEAVELQLRGGRFALDEVSAASFSVGAALDLSALGEGTHRVSALVTASNLPIGVTLLEDKVELQIKVEAIASLPDEGAAVGQTPDEGTP